jgi:hypothetical protein
MEWQEASNNACFWIYLSVFGYIGTFVASHDDFLYGKKSQMKETTQKPH